MNNDNIYKSGLGDGWKTLQKSAENDPELKNELNDIELQDLKRHDYRQNPKTRKWENSYGESISGSEAYRERHIIRLKAQKFIKYKNELDKFMRAPNYEEFKKGSFEKALDNVIDRKVKPKDKSKDHLKVKPYVMPELDTLYHLVKDGIKDKANDGPIKEPNFSKSSDPDLSRGIGYLLGVKK